MNDPIVTQLSIMLLITIIIVFIGVGSAYFPNSFQGFWKGTNIFIAILKFPFKIVMSIFSFLYRKYQMFKFKKEVRQIKIVSAKDSYEYFKTTWK